LSPNREYNLILVDKNLEDVEKVKKELMETIYPKSTHMDFNISASLSIAASVTKSRIILTGLGADEIFSGYSRYRIAFKRAGF
jgi:asparagine synthetase B (glutamine-hydrolysing)